MKIKGLITLAAMAIAIGASADIPLSYYTSVNGKADSQLKTALSQLLYNHTLVSSYSNLPNYFRSTDVYPGTENWWDMYSSLETNIYITFGTYMNREHAFPKSWWGGSQSTPAYTDLNHLYPAEAKANQAKSNFPLGEVATATFDNGVVKVGYAVTGQGGGAAKVFEPNEEYKGDFARTYFYMVTCYQGLTWDTKYMWMLLQNDYPTLKTWAIDLLLKWSREDPVSQKEIDRNEQVYKFQNNRNPFIDYPELAEYIWGNKVGLKFYAGDREPTGEPSLTTPVQGMALEFEQVAEGKTSSSLLFFKGENLRGSLSLALTGADKGMFSIPTKSISASAVNGETGFSLRVEYKPTALGEHTAKLIVSDGGMEGSLGVQLIGECLPVPTLTAVNALQPSDITSDSYTANWEQPTEVVDYFIVSRTRYTNGGSSSEDIVAESNSLLIEGFGESDSESYNVRSVRLGYESPRSNEIFVEHAGVTGVESDTPFGWAYMPNGVRFVTAVTLYDVKIYDVTGRLVRVLPVVENNMEVELAVGAYVVSAEGTGAPLRVLVRP